MPTTLPHRAATPCVRPPRWRHRLPGLAVACALLATLPGCASIGGMQAPITASDLQAGICPSAAEIDTFNALAGTKRQEFRDKVILGCVKAIDLHYLAFKTSLHREGVGSSLATDILSLGLATGAAISRTKAASRLAAGSALTLGVGAAINKDVFFQQTLPAIEAAMDARRDKLLKAIIDAEKSDPAATRYTLASAGIDLSAYEAAGNIYAAIAELTSEAGKAAADAKADLTASQTAAYTAVEFSADIDTRLRALTDKLWLLKDPADRAKLDAVALKLGLKIKSFEVQRVAILDEVVKRAGTGDAKAQLDSLEADLRPLLS